ncbi:MAG: sulfite exporter TauE/SafE family protein [Prochlorotrichaceae cyanobacterium]
MDSFILQHLADAFRTGYVLLFSGETSFLSSTVSLFGIGIGVGLLAGLLGVGGGLVMVPLLVALGYAPIESVATSSSAIVLTAAAGSLQNWRKGYLSIRALFGLGVPGLFTVPGGVWLADRLPSSLLLGSFAVFLFFNVYLLDWSKKVQSDPSTLSSPAIVSPILARTMTGGAAGFLAGLFGIGGGLILVPFQVVLLREPIKRAIQTSLGVVLLTSIAATLGHSLHGYVRWMVGFSLGAGGVFGVQVSTRLLPKLSDRWVTRLFRGLLILLGTYTLGEAISQGF